MFILKDLVSQKIIKIFLICFITVLIIISLNIFSKIQAARQYLNPLTTQDEFIKTLLLQTLSLYDLGVVDVNNDDQIDLFTANHWHGQNLLISDENHHFSDGLASLKLNHSPDFPGLEASVDLVTIDQPGLYIYWKNKTLVVEAYDLSNFENLTGLIRLPKSGEILRQHKATLNRNESQAQALLPWDIPMRNDLTVYEFSMQSDGKLEFQFGGGPTTQFLISERLPLEQVYIGKRGVHPQSHDFVLYLYDRHGMAWADINRDQNLDVFISHGGFNGRLKEFIPNARDELFINSGQTYVNQTLKADLVKDGCPGRQANWIDFNQDDRLDLYLSCGRDDTPDQVSANKLYQHLKDDHFINVAPEKGVAMPGSGKFVWLDANQDGRLDLLWATNSGIWLYQNSPENFQPQRISQQHRFKALTVADYDNDGDFDVFGASSLGNILLSNNNGQLAPISLSSIGLPKNSYGANWVDYDNDGLMDLHLLPNGLYQQQSNGQYQATKLLKLHPSRQAYSATTWFDYDNDGLRDLLLPIRYKEQTKTIRWWRRITYPQWVSPSPDMNAWELMLYTNQIKNDNGWLELKLVGSEGNPQAIGAIVRVTTSENIQTQMVGQSEGSLYSQGHYRLYFGLGMNQKVNSIDITWPDGLKQRVLAPNINQLLVVKKEGIQAKL